VLTTRETIEDLVKTIKTKIDSAKIGMSMADKEDIIFDVDTVRDFIMELSSNKDKKMYSDMMQSFEDTVSSL